MWCGHPSHWRLVPELDLTHEDVLDLSDLVDPAVAGHGVTVITEPSRLRVSLKHAHPCRRKTGVTPFGSGPAAGPALRLRCFHDRTIGTTLAESTSWMGFSGSRMGMLVGPGTLCETQAQSFPRSRTSCSSAAATS
jgi:hypothetical protein